MNSAQKRSKAKEYLWLAVALMCLVITVHSLTRGTFSRNWYFLGLALLALLFWFIWRTIRKKSGQSE
jgi:hypothetical protein